MITKNIVNLIEYTNLQKQTWVRSNLIHFLFFFSFGTEDQTPTLFYDRSPILIMKQENLRICSATIYACVCRHAHGQGGWETCPRSLRSPCHARAALDTADPTGLTARCGRRTRVSTALHPPLHSTALCKPLALSREDAAKSLHRVKSLQPCTAGCVGPQAARGRQPVRCTSLLKNLECFSAPVTFLFKQFVQATQNSLCLLLLPNIGPVQAELFWNTISFRAIWLGQYQTASPNIPNKVLSVFLLESIKQIDDKYELIFKNHGGHAQFKVLKEKDCQPRILCLVSFLQDTERVKILPMREY